LIGRNIVIYKNQREFIENAAHELQTPIAVLQGKIDVLMQQDQLTESQIKIYNVINESLASFNRLNKNLLLLSKIEKNIAVPNEDVKVNEAIKEQLSFFEEQSQQKHISIEFVESAEINLHTNKAFLDVLISNMLMNAIRHNVADGIIKIEITRTELIISNTGIAEPINENMLYNRFGKMATSKEGNGLGLSIVKKIVSVNEWAISYSFENKMHRFRIEF